MPRPKKEDVGLEPKKRSRTGCWPCKSRKVKCGEEKPACTNCVKSGEVCDYSIRLNWGGRARRDKDGTSDADAFTFVATPDSVSAAQAASHGHEHVFSSQHIITSALSPAQRPSSAHASSRPITPEPALKEEVNQTHGVQATLPAFNTGMHQSLQSERSPPTSAPIDFNWSPQHRAKRIRISSPQGSPSQSKANPAPVIFQSIAQADQASPGSTYFTPQSISSVVNTPATPGSSINSGSPYPLSATHVTSSQLSPDLRRLSVKSLLSDPAEGIERPHYPRTDSQGFRTYGFDHGLPDEDISRNRDQAAIRPRSPELRRPSNAMSEGSTSSGEVDPKDMAFEPGGYYAKPVHIRLSKALEPLPAELLENPINLLYFHHFINHTGRILVPHDCPENPFRSVLPQMAVRNKQLLHLMLAFSASHRARLLNQPEPATRIALWMDDVLPALRQALSEPTSPGTADPTDLSSLAPLATAIMLSSLEIISPNTFAVPISWQNHLDVARRLIVAKGGLHHLAQKADGAVDKAVFFLSRWFAYLDVLGSLSGSKQQQPLGNAYLEDGGGLWLVNRNDTDVYQIDCFFGFSGRCIALLAAVAELAAACDRQRIDPDTRKQRPDWQPSDAVSIRADGLKQRLVESARFIYHGCMHADPNSPTGSQGNNQQDIDDMIATNEAFHWSGLIHLSRRVLGLPREHAEVQDSVQKALQSLSRVRRGSTAESCLLLPMFTAGCEALSDKDRQFFNERLKAVEGWGMQQVGKARTLMQKVWETGEAWEAIVDGEFLG